MISKRAFHQSLKTSLTVTVLATVLALTPPSGLTQFTTVRIQVADVGQADGILIRTPNKRWIVIDAGTDEL